MEIAVRIRDLDFAGDIREEVERSLDYAVDRHEGRIDRILVCLSDLNGPRGGVDKLCRMTAYVRGIRPILISEKGANLVAVIGRAGRRLGSRIRGNIERRRRSGTSKYRATIRSPR